MADTNGKKSKILIVDDIPENIQVLQGILTGRYRLGVATQGEKALRLAGGDDPPDLILLDIMMPGMNGYEVCQTLKAQENTRKIPVIFVTAREDAVDEKHGFEVGAVDYITKPVVPAIVEARVATHLALRQAMVDLEHQNEILVEMAKLRDQVDRIMKHDLKNPLSAFISIPSMLKRRKDLPEDMVEIISMMEKSGYRMLEMINKTLDLYKMETGTYIIRPVPVDILKIMRQITFELGALMNAKAVQLVFLVGETPATEGDAFLIDGEEHLCYSMLANLVKNAIEASPEGGKVSVSVVQEPFRRIDIHNVGIIPLEIRDKFMQKHVTHGKKGGTGLGGYSARLMATTLGGVIRFTSDEKAGTTVSISFGETPFIMPATTSGPGTEATSGTPEKMRILVVDDNGIVRFSIQEMLRGIGFHQIILANDAWAAQTILQEGQPIHLIISDQRMPGMTGVELLEWVRNSSSCKGIPFIMITSEADSSLAGRLVSMGGTDFITKPYSPDVLQDKVKKWIPRMQQLVHERRKNHGN